MKSGSAQSRMSKLQQYIDHFEYNHTGRKFVHLKKTQGLYRVSRTAKEIIHASLPIKCIEAVFLGAYLTIEMPDVLRLPVSFKSYVESAKCHFQHIVMPVCHNSRWGAIGLSRAPTLGYKKIKFDSLADLCKDYRDAYSGVGHTLQRIYVGLPFGRDQFNQEEILWRVLRLKVDSIPWDEIEAVLMKFTARFEDYFSHYKSMKALPADFWNTLKRTWSRGFRNAAVIPQARLLLYLQAEVEEAKT